jgi:hypothetical protein
MIIEKELFFDAQSLLGVTLKIASNGTAIVCSGDWVYRHCNYFPRLGQGRSWYCAVNPSRWLPWRRPIVQAVLFARDHWIRQLADYHYAIAEADVAKKVADEVASLVEDALGGAEP